MGNEIPISQRQDDRHPHEEHENTLQFKQCFDKLLSNPHFLDELLSQNCKLGPGLLKFFPNAATDYQEFKEMVTFLRKFHLHKLKTKFANHNALKTNLIERFFMIIRGIEKYEDLDRIKMGDYELEQLFIELMKLFVSNPEKGILIKLKKYIGIQNSIEISVKQFASLLDHIFPNINKHLSHYALLKFRDMAVDGHLLKAFNSGIIKDDSVILALMAPQLANKDIKKLYSIQSNGKQFFELQKRVIGYTGPWLVIIESTDQTGTYKFGAYQAGPIMDVGHFQGNSKCFMFTIHPNFRFMAPHKGQKHSHYFYVNTIDEIICKKRRGIGFGGDNLKEDFKLWIDQDYKKSKVFNGNDLTYGFGALANPSSENINIKKMEVWGLGTLKDAEKQTIYWEFIEKDIISRNKSSHSENVQRMIKKHHVHRFYEEEVHQKQFENYNKRQPQPIQPNSSDQEQE